MCTVMEKVCLSVCLSVYRSVCVCVCVCVCVTEALRAVMEKASPIVRAHVHMRAVSKMPPPGRARARSRVFHTLKLSTCVSPSPLAACPSLTPHAAAGSQCRPLANSTESGARRVEGAAELLLRPRGRVRVSIWQSVVTRRALIPNCVLALRPVWGPATIVAGLYRGRGRVGV
jgi:hypothetical protein